MAKNPQRKFILVEVDTVLSNKEMEAQARAMLGDVATTVLQLHVNSAKRPKNATISSWRKQKKAERRGRQ